MKRITYLFAFIAGLALAACHKDSARPATPAVTPVETGPYIYVGGSIAGGNSTLGVFFKNNISKTIGNGTAKRDTLKNTAFIVSMATSDSIVYMAAGAAGYWKKDSFISVSTASQINYLAFNNGHIALGGLDLQFNLSYWLDNNKTSLTGTFDRNTYPNEGGVNAGVSGMTLSANGAVLLSGNYEFTDETLPNVADTSTVPGTYWTIWNNGNKQILYHDYWNVDPVYPATFGIAAAGNDVYVAAMISVDSFRKTEAGYFKNGVFNSINNDAFQPNAIYTSGTDVYIVGFTFTGPGKSNSNAAYWKNGTLVPLNGVSAKAIVVSGADMYILGVDRSANYVVWKNGAVLETLGSATNLNLSSIAIGD